MDWCALNVDRDREGVAERALATKRTTEAEESRLTACYEYALKLAASGDRGGAIDNLRAVLSHALANAANISFELARVKYLALKNLGKLLEDEDDERERASGRGARGRADGDEALRCYAAAVEMDGEDVMLWRRLGGAAAARGEYGVARLAYERGIALRPKNQLALEDLGEVLLAVGDLDSARAIGREILKIDPSNARASGMARAPEMLEVAPRLKRAGAAESAGWEGAKEIAIRFSPTTEKSWALLAAVLARLGGVSSPEAEVEKTPSRGGGEGAEAVEETGTLTPTKTTESLATPMQTPVAPSPLVRTTGESTGELVNMSFLRVIDGVDVPCGAPLGKSLRFIFDSERCEREVELEAVETVDTDVPSQEIIPAPSQAPSLEVIDLVKDNMHPTMTESETTMTALSEQEPAVPPPNADIATKGKRRRVSVEGPVRKSRRQEEMDAKRAIEEEKERAIASQKAADMAARKKLLDERKWTPEQQIARTLLKMVGIEHEDPVVLVQAMKEKETGGAAVEDEQRDEKKKHLRAMKEAAAKKAEEERRLKTTERVAAFVNGVDGSNSGVAHVAWRFLSTTAARWRPDTEDECAPSPSMLFTLVQIYGVGHGDELAPKARILLCLADAAIIAARACSLGQPERKMLQVVAQGFLEQASTVMDRDFAQDFQAESLFLRHKLAELSGEESSARSYYLDRAQEVAPDDAEVPPPSCAIVDAAPTRFTKQLLRAAMDSMKVKEVVTGAASRFAKGQTSELVSTLTPLLLADEDVELADGLTLTQSERQEALKVLAMAAREEGSACIVIELKALKYLYDLTKDFRCLRSMAETIDLTKRAHTKHALDTVEQLGIQTLAASLFELHYRELAKEPGVKKNLIRSGVASANMEAAALILSAVQRAAKVGDLEMIELHEKLHDRLADCRCCCGDGRKGAFLKSSLVHLARSRNRITAAREARQIAEEPTGGKKRAGRTKVGQLSVPVDKAGGKSRDARADDEEEEGGARRRVRRQRVSSIETDDRTPQDKADRKVLERLDKLIVQFCYCVYGFELERPTRRCREEGGASEAMLAISSEQNAADLWLSLQPYAMQSKDRQRETIVAIMQAIRSHVSNPPLTKQGLAVDAYLAEFDDYLDGKASIDQVVAKERVLARAMISQPTPDEALMAFRLPGIPAKNDKSEAMPTSPRESVVHVPGQGVPDATVVEDRIMRFAEVYRTLYQFCVEVDGPILEIALEEEQTDLQEIFALLESCMPSGVTPFERKSVANRAPEIVNSGLVAHSSADFTRMLKFDIQYNLKRPQSWIALADHLDTIKDIVLNDSAKIMTVEMFRASPMMKLVKTYQVAIRRALLAADEALVMTYHEGHEETEWIRSQIHERLGQASYELLQNAPPLYDGRINSLDSCGDSFKAALVLCKSAYARAAESNTEEWTYPYFLAKLAKKGGEPLTQVLAMHAGALALLPGSLEAIYQVANIRLRLLMSIDAAGRKKMTPEDQAITIAVLKQPFVPGEMQNSWIGAYRDSIEALLFIVKNYPKFHKASYRLAWSRLKKSPGEIGHARKALEYLQPLFTVPRTGTFKAMMVEIDDTNLGIDNRDAARSEFNEDDDRSVIYEAGINESRRRFTANVRRALQLYIALLYTNEDIQTLSNAIAYLSDFKTTIKSRLSVVSSSKDIRMYAFGLMIRALCQTLSQPVLSNDIETQRGETIPAHKRDVFVDFAYSMWFEFAIPARGNAGSWESNVSDAMEQIAFEDKRTDSGPDLIKEPYQTAFFNASEIGPSSPVLMDFERYALEHINSLEVKNDIVALAAQYSLCSSRLTECKAKDANVLEQGRSRLKVLQNANKDAFIRCSQPTLDALAKGEINLTAAEAETDAKSISDDVSAKQAAVFVDGETILITALRMHRTTKQESMARVHEFSTNRKNSLLAYTQMAKTGQRVADELVARGTDLHRVYTELLESARKNEVLQKEHHALVEAALASENQTTNPEQLKLIKSAYEELTAANETHARLTTALEQALAVYREETTEKAAEMAKIDISSAESSAYITRVASAIAKHPIQDVSQAETLLDATITELRKIKPKKLSWRTKKPTTKKNATAANDRVEAMETAAEPTDVEPTEVDVAEAERPLDAARALDVARDA